MTSSEVYAKRLQAAAAVADRLESKQNDLMEAAALDAGFPIKITALEVKLAVEHLRTMQEEIDWVRGGEPYGTVAAILPYDAPAVMLARLGGAALLTGNLLRFSFSSQTPRCAEILADICQEFTPFEPVVGTDNREFGRRCIHDENVRVLFISGASQVGQVYRSQHEAFDKIFFAGPGGMPAAVVFPDANLEAASRFIARRAFINGGQYCTTIKKAFIHIDLYPLVRERILEHAQKIKVGDPQDPETDIGPIIVERTRSTLQTALQKCSKGHLVFGQMEGEWIQPLILEMPEEEIIPDLELFGPFLVLKPFRDPATVVQEAVRTRYGFLLAFFGTASTEARRLFTANFGMVYDNPDFLFTPMRLPFGGRKESGWILERGCNGWIERDGAFLYSKELIKPAN